MNPFSAVRKFVGQEITRRRRRRAVTIFSDRLPENLRIRPDRDEFAPIGSFTAVTPVTLYWGRERNFEMDGHTPAGLPHWFGKFDWVIGYEFGWVDPSHFPRSVLCEPSYLPALLSFMKRRFPDGPAGPSVLGVGTGTDFLLSWQRRSLLKGLGRYFDCMYYEAKDKNIYDIGALPMAYSEHYVRSNGAFVLNLAQTLVRHEKSMAESLSVLAAWGAWWPSLDHVIPDRKQAREFADRSPFVTHQQFASNEWFQALSRFDFMLCPLGNGIQAPKMVEAVMMGCIPIATRHPTFVELNERGFPMLLVDQWDEVTEHLLRESYPRLFKQVMEFRPITMDVNRWWDFSFPCHTHMPAELAPG